MNDFKMRVAEREALSNECGIYEFMDTSTGIINIHESMFTGEVRLKVNEYVRKCKEEYEKYFNCCCDDGTVFYSLAPVEFSDGISMLDKAKQAVLDLFNDRTEITGWGNKITMDDVYIVWFCKTLQNWKALVSTTVDDGRYYEVIYNGDKREIYVDTYKKESNSRLF